MRVVDENNDENISYWLRKSLYLLNDLRNFNEIFRKDVTYDNIKSHKKLELHTLSRRYIFGKITKVGANRPISSPILLRVRVITYIIFGRSQPSFPVKAQLQLPWSEKLWQIKIRNLVIIDLTYLSNTFLGLSYADLCCRESISCYLAILVLIFGQQSTLIRQWMR